MLLSTNQATSPHLYLNRSLEGDPHDHSQAFVEDHCEKTYRQGYEACSATPDVVESPSYELWA